MAIKFYEIPSDVGEIFSDVKENDGGASYRIVNYEEGMSMNNHEAMQHFIDCVEIPDDYIEENLGTQITLVHPDYSKKVTIDSGGLGDFFCHGYECSWTDEG